MEASQLIEQAATAIRSVKYTRGTYNRRISTPTRRDMHYAAAALPALLYALADATAERGRFSSGDLIKLAQEIEARGDGA